MMQSRRDWAQLAFAILLAFALVVLTLLIDDVAEREVMSWDALVLSHLHNLHGPFLNLILRLFAMIGGGMGFLLLLIPLMNVYLLRGQFGGATFLAIAVLGARVVGIVMKYVLDRPRPHSVDLDYAIPRTGMVALVGLVTLACGIALWKKHGQGRAALSYVTVLVVVAVVAVALGFVPSFMGTSDQSFPSGHASSSMALAAAAAFLAWRTRFRWLVCALGGVFVVAVGLSRVHFGFHYPSDIIAGWCVSLIWVAVVWAILGPWVQGSRSEST